MFSFCFREPEEVLVLIAAIVRCKSGEGDSSKGWESRLVVEVNVTTRSATAAVAAATPCTTATAVAPFTTAATPVTAPAAASTTSGGREASVDLDVHLLREHGCVRASRLLLRLRQHIDDKWL